MLPLYYFSENITASESSSKGNYNNLFGFCEG
jgi:hypothetical protein